MQLEEWKKNLSAFLEKKSEHGQKQAAYTDSWTQFQPLESDAERLDEPVREALGEMGRQYREDLRLLEQERDMLEGERTRMEGEIRAHLDTLRLAREKLERAAGSGYGGALYEALRACRRSEAEYRSLLALLEDHRAGEAGDVPALRENLAREQTLLTEVHVKEQAVGMLAGMSPEQRAAVTYYTGLGYLQINPYLRGKSAGVTPQCREQILRLSALLGSQVTDRPMRVYRGVSPDTAMVRGGRKGLDAYSDQELVGKLLVDGGFVSTSLREESAFSGTMLVLDLPPGSRGAYVGDISQAQHYEREFLMDRNQVFRVTGVTRKNGKRYIHATALVR